jgi:putative SOS response-associated peptidase YedK
MCNRYVTPDEAALERFWHIGRENSNPWRARAEIFPRAQGPFIRGADDRDRALVVGQWGLIPWFAKSATLTYSTNNARFEELEGKPSFKQPWLRAQRCIIPAQSFDEPCWETGKNVWWRFRRADGAPWGLAGLWNAWADEATGEIVESYTMLTLNADAHPLMARMHKPDPRLPAGQQDKRSVIPIESADVEAWLFGSIEEAKALMRLPPVEAFDAGPMPPAGN